MWKLGLGMGTSIRVLNGGIIIRVAFYYSRTCAELLLATTVQVTFIMSAVNRKNEVLNVDLNKIFGIKHTSSMF